MFVCIYMYIKLKLHKTIFGIKKLHVPLKKSILKKKNSRISQETAYTSSSTKLYDDCV